MSKTIVEEHCNGILSVVNSVDGAIFKIILKNPTSVFHRKNAEIPL